MPKLKSVKKIQKDERKSEQLEVKEIPVPLNSNHPHVPHGVLPKHEFSIGIIA